MKFDLVLDQLSTRGIIPPAQLKALQEIIAGKIFSLYSELRALLYFGVALLLIGIGLIIKDYFAQLGHIAIIGSLSLTSIGAIVYCFIKSKPYSNGEVEAPSLSFDYILYLGCALYSLDLAYLETQFHLFGNSWPIHLLFSSIIFLLLAYRFDNGLVLSLALSTLAAYFGFQLAGWQSNFEAYYRFYAILFGLLVLAVGILFFVNAIKKHFFDIYANFAAHFLFLAALSGVWIFGLMSPHFLLLIFLCSIAIAYTFYAHNFLYLLYAVLYGYAGLTIIALKNISSPSAIFLYFIFSPILVAYAAYKVYLLSRTGGEEQ